jgi:diguanylate cyclase (GGDEF)-like protein/PAS domain S-box-containing protein
MIFARRHPYGWRRSHHGLAQERSARADPPAVDEKRHEARVRHSNFDSLVRSHPEGMFSALGPDGFRVPMPVSVGLAGERVIPPPAEGRATLIDLVVPEDARTVVEIWQRCERTGMSIGSVRTRSAPNRPLTLTFIDLTDRYGVIVGSFTEQEGGQHASTRLTPSLLVPARPRTAVMTKAWDSVITSVDERCNRMLGWAEEQLLGQRSSEFLHPDDHDRALFAWMEMLATLHGQRVRLRHRCADGNWLWVEVENSIQPDESGDHTKAVITTLINDISDEMAAHEALDRQERLFRRLAESLPIGVIQLEPDGSLAYANSRSARILGVEGAQTLDTQLSTVVARDRPALDAALAAALAHGKEQDIEVDVVVPGAAESRRCQVTLIALSDQDGTPGALACVSDITESAKARAELTVKATFDALTGCYNRSSVQALLERALAEDDLPVGVVYVDLDKFKPVNDTYGHAAGDELLVHTARCLTGLLREGDAVARLGGDEFLVVARGAGGPERVLAVAERAAAALCRPLALRAGTVDQAASIGAAVSAPGDTAETLIARADAAMYVSKRAGDALPVLG